MLLWQRYTADTCNTIWFLLKLFSFRPVSYRILKIFKEDVITDGPSMPITFNHSKNPFRELCRIYKNSAHKLVRPPVVYFVSDSGEEDLLEEEAADIGDH